MKKYFGNKIIYGYIMAIIGFIFILISATNYLLGWKLTTLPLTLSIAFLAIGTGWISKSRKSIDNNLQ